jgi:hypothetical protein
MQEFKDSKEVIKFAKLAEKFNKPNEAASAYLTGLKLFSPDIDLMLEANNFFYLCRKNIRVLKHLFDHYEWSGATAYDKSRVANCIRTLMFIEQNWSESMRWMDKTIGHLTDLFYQGIFLKHKPRENKSLFEDGLATNLTFNLCNSLYQENIRLAPCHGSLLGIQRDGRLLPWDKDVDLAGNYSDARLIKNWFVDKGYTYVKETSYDTLMSFKSNSEMPDLDIMLFQPHPKLPNISLGGFITFTFPEYWWIEQHYSKFEIVPGLLPNGEKAYTISDPTKFLEENYGATWKTPDPEWVTFASEPCMPRSDLNLYYCKVQLVKRWFQGNIKSTLIAATATREKYPCDTFVNEAYISLSMQNKKVSNVLIATNKGSEVI